MKIEKGITLVSLVIYVILITFIIAGISSLTASFYSNLEEFDEASESAVSYSKFNMYFLSDIKRKDISVYRVENSEEKNKYIILRYTEDDVVTGEGITATGTKNVDIEYSLQNNAIYRNKVKICENVKDVVFGTNPGNTTINVRMLIGNDDRLTTYKIENIKY